MRVYVDIQGIDELIKDMQKMVDKGKSVLDAVAMAGAEYAMPKVVSAIKPSNEDDIHLRDHIKTRKMKKKSPVKSSAVIAIGTGSAEYAMHLEVGHRTKGGGHVPAKKFIRTTIDTNADEIGRIMGDEFIRKVGI